jgi:hypothetical protein
MSGKKPKKQMLKPRDIREQSRVDWQNNNPNYSNYYGSSTTTFDGDQANVTQTYSEPVQGLVDQRMDFLSGGPQQYSPQGNDALSQMFTQSANNVNRRNGNQMKPMQQGQPPQPELSFGYDNPSVYNKPLAVDDSKEPNTMQQLGGALTTAANNMPTSIEQSANGLRGGGGGGNGMGQLAQLLQMYQQRQNKPIDYQTGR